MTRASSLGTRILAYFGYDPMEVWSAWIAITGQPCR